MQGTLKRLYHCFLEELYLRGNRMILTKTTVDCRHDEKAENEYWNKRDVLRNGITNDKECYWHLRQFSSGCTNSLRKIVKSRSLNAVVS